MVKFHQLKNLAATDLALGQWHLFSNYDTFTQTAQDIGNSFQQLERGLLKTMRERNRTPCSILLLLGDSLLEDEKLLYNPQNLFTVLHSMFKQLKSQVKTYVDLLPDKAKPLNDIRIFVTKPLPKPEKFYKNRAAELHRLAKVRHTYNDKLIGALHGLDMNFLNPGIQSSNGRAFHRIKTPGHKEHFLLTPEGLHQYWYSLSSGIEKMHRCFLKSQVKQD